MLNKINLKLVYSWEGVNAVAGKPPRSQRAYKK